MDFVGAAERLIELAARVGDGVGQVISDEELNARIDRLPTRFGPYGVDPFGFDPTYLKKVIGVGAWVYRKYFRCDAYNVDRIPDGRCFLVANHSGQLPFDGMMVILSVLLEREPPRFPRSMIERFVPTTPFVSPFFARCGQILGTPENCRRLLDAGEAILVFPEGVRGLNKTWRDRYRLQGFGQGFMRLALQTDTPIVPCAVIGAEEQAPTFHNAQPLAKLLGLPALPLGVPPFLPLPTKYRIHFGEPMHFKGDPNDEDEVIVRKTEETRAVIQRMLDEGLGARTGVFW